MKRLIIVLAAILFSAVSFSSSAAVNNDEALKLTDLWKEYQVLSEKDLPQKQLTLLEKIRSKSLDARYPVDFYQACHEMMQLRIGRNWKEYDNAAKEFESSVDEYGLPVMIMYHIMSMKSLPEAMEYADANMAALKSSNEKWFRGQWYFGPMADYIRSLISNDCEFAVWAAAVRQVKISAKMQSCLDGRYPDQAVYEFVSGTKDKKSLTAHAEKYAGKAAALLSRAELLSMEFDDLNAADGTTEAQFKAFYDKCVAFEKERKSFSGAEADLAAYANAVKAVMERMEAHAANVAINDDVVVARLRNLQKLDVTLEKDGKRVWSTTLVNKVNSFYVMDEVTCKLPTIDDGDYKVLVNGKDVETTFKYSRTTISLAIRKDAEGLAIYAADYKSGKPLPSVDVTLLKQGKEEVTVKGMSLDGFTYLPSAIASKLPKSSNSHMIRCSFTTSDGVYRTSRSIHTSSYYSAGSDANSSRVFGELFFDRSAFHPGESISFKGLLYKYEGRKYEVEAGKKVSVVLYDSEYTKIAEKQLKTNEFGSVAGSFDLPVGARNGMFTIELCYGDEVRSSKNFRVDEFVLPTFDVRFETLDRLFLKGDTVRLKAWAASYSGHSLSSARITAAVRKGYWNADAKECNVAVSPDGSFEIVVENAEEGYYNVDVKVVDSTGETLTFSTSFSVLASLSVSVSLENSVEASIGNVVNGDVLKLKSLAGYDESCIKGNNGPVDVVYRVKNEKDKVVAVGSMKLGETTCADISSLPSGTYVVTVDATAVKADGSVSSDCTELTIYKVSDNDKAFYSDEESMFRVISESGNAITLQAATGKGPLWACVEIFGEGNVLLRSEVINLSGKKGENGSAKLFTYGYSEKWSDAVSLNVFYFKNDSQKVYSKVIRRQKQNFSLPLSISRFSDVTMPSSKYTLSLKSNPDVEALVSIFDKSTETIMGNEWSRVGRVAAAEPYVAYRYTSGSASSRTYLSNYEFDEVPISFALGSSSRRMMMKSAVYEYADGAVAEESAAVMNVEMDSAAGEVTVRENFANTVAFEPFLRSDASGDMSMEFTTSDKLSTYIISVFAHDKAVREAVLRQEFKVTLPVKLAVVEPQLLYVGDHYIVKANLSSTSEKAVGGRVALYLYDTEKYETAKPIDAQYAEVSVDANGAAAVEFAVDVPDVKVLGMKLVFVGKDGGMSISDAVFVPVPVKKAVQTIREAHSAIWLQGQDKEGIIASLRGMFVNVPAEDAVLSEKNIMEMIREAIPEKISTDARNAISLSETIYASVLAKSLGMESVDGDLLEKLLACCNDDGGFAWFEGMSSSPSVTAVVLMRAGSLRERGLDMGIDDDVLAKAAEYLDKAQFSGNEHPYWCGGLSLGQYLYVRAMYADVKLAAKPDREARKEIKSYLVPKKARGMNGQILAKARRLRTLMLLSASEEGVDMANSFGVRLGAAKKLSKSLIADEASLMEYAVAHKSGGKYYPNAVMPFRGLMESELYAHSLLCDLFRDLGEDGLADDIRLWIMVQKETQKWSSDPAYIEAIASVMDGTEDLKQTAVLILSAEKELPFQQVEAAGNGFKVEVLYKREDGTDVKEGDVLSVGDKIFAECRVWNEENRSFVHLDVPRPASLRPVDQLSGHVGWWFHPIARGAYSYTPQGYRNVYAGGTEYFFDAFPEEELTIKEAYYVTQAGVFAAPAVVIESLYAPHYVANCGYRGMQQSE